MKILKYYFGQITEVDLIYSLCLVIRVILIFLKNRFGLCSHFLEEL